MGKCWLRGNLCKFIAFNRLNLVSFHPPSLHELHRVAWELCKSPFSKLNLKLREISPSFHWTKSLRVVAEATALASPAQSTEARHPTTWRRRKATRKWWACCIPCLSGKQWRIENWMNTWGSKGSKEKINYNFWFMILLANACPISGKTIVHKKTLETRYLPTSHQSVLVTKSDLWRHLMFRWVMTIVKLNKGDHMFVCLLGPSAVGELKYWWLSCWFWFLHGRTDPRCNTGHLVKCKTVRK